MLFIAGFDLDTNPATDFDGVGANSGSNDLTGTKSRTGVGCYVSSGPFGPYKTFTGKTALIAGVAELCTSTPAGAVFTFFSGGTGGGSVIQAQVVINSNGSLSVLSSNTPFQNHLGTTSPGIILTNVYAYIELDVSSVNSVTGAFTLRVNGATVLTGTNVNTNPAASGTIDTVQINGPGGGLTAYFDDFYIFDHSGGTNNSLAGPARVYTALPVSDNTPLQWTPSTAGTHFNLVNGIPAETQSTYVSAASSGLIDEYLYDLSQVPTSVTILGVQHGLDSFLDAAGSGSVDSACGNTNAGAPIALSTSAHIYPFPRDTDPVAAGPWTRANLLVRPFGPNRTA